MRETQFRFSRKFVSLLIVIVFALVTFMQPAVLFAESDTEVNTENRTQAEEPNAQENSQTPTESTEKKAEDTNVDNESSNNSESTTLTQSETSSADQEVATEVKKEMDFLYIESSELEAPGTQNIVVSWQEEVPLDEVSDIRLQLKDADNNVLSIKENKRTDKSILFEKTFEKSDIGKYTITGVKYTVGDIETQLKFNDVEIKATFEVVETSTDASSIE